MITNINKRFFPKSKAANSSILIAVLGVIIFAIFSFHLTFTHEYGPYGIRIYDQYYFSLLQGRLDIKAIELQYEGHYLTDGTGYLYHGISPLITRFALGWLIDLESVSLAPFSIWLWACIGTLIYHLTFYNIITKFWPESIDYRGWAIAIALLTWFATPGLLIAANISLYHEVLAISYAATAAFIYVFTKYQFFDFPLRKAIIPLSLLAAITVHARPNMAVGLYIAVVLLCLIGLWKFKRQMILSSFFAMLVLGTSGLGYIGINILKFGSQPVAHGSFSDGPVQYGTTFWANETSSNSERAKTFTENGFFNAKRILPNFAMYTFEPPIHIVGNKIANEIEEKFYSITKPSLGFIILEGPRIGILYLWLAWISIIIYSLSIFSNWHSLKSGIIILIATGTAYLITLSFGAITFRYRFDMWPFFASLVVLLLPIVAKNTSELMQGTKRLFVVLLIGISINLSIKTAYNYSKFFTEVPGSFFERWTVPFCKKLVETKNLGSIRIKELCE